MGSAASTLTVAMSPDGVVKKQIRTKNGITLEVLPSETPCPSLPTPVSSHQETLGSKTCTVVAELNNAVPMPAERSATKGAAHSAMSAVKCSAIASQTNCTRVLSPVHEYSSKPP
jgi:hypothetical protein